MEWWTLFIKDWGDVSAWGLLVGTWAGIVVGVLTDRIWSGKRGRRAEAAAEKSAELARTALDQNTKLIESQGFAEYVFKELLPPRTTPKRGAKLSREGSPDDGTQA